MGVGVIDVDGVIVSVFHVLRGTNCFFWSFDQGAPESGRCSKQHHYDGITVPVSHHPWRVERLLIASGETQRNKSKTT